MSCLTPTPGCHAPCPPLGGNLFISELGNLLMRDAQTNLWHIVSIDDVQGVAAITLSEKGALTPNEILVYYKKAPWAGESFVPQQRADVYFNQDGTLFLRHKGTGVLYRVTVESPNDVVQLTIEALV
jgi:hypothetical protein